MSTPRKSLRDIKTLSGRVDRIANPYMAYMQIACLEMEKVRRGREKVSASHRAQDIDVRLREIEREKAAVLRALALEARASTPTTADGNPARRPAPEKSMGGVRIRY